jgi:pimeloyl-ACP methyl ester carboxylesterase
MTHAPALTVTRPSLALLGTEPWRAAFEYASHKLQRKPKRLPGGDGHPVVIFPGLATDGAAVAPLRNFCQSLGYTAMDWGRGFNTGPHGAVDVWMAELADHTLRLLDGHDGKVTLIGWSLGGFYARELGKLLAPRVRQVITIGTPFNADADHSRVGWLLRLLNGSAPALDPALGQRLRTPPPVPTTSIYSRTDGIVAWQTCCHARALPQVQDVEIKGSHIGMGWNPAVLDVVADRLGQRPGDWHAYRARASAA